MEPKFSVRRDMHHWIVVAPSGQHEVTDNFSDAIRVLDYWIEEYRVKIAGQYRINRTIARA